MLPSARPVRSQPAECLKVHVDSNPVTQFTHTSDVGGCRPNGDGGGLSTGDLTAQSTGEWYAKYVDAVIPNLAENKPVYPVRVSGDRVWAFADKDSPEVKMTEQIDLAYFFVSSPLSAAALFLAVRVFIDDVVFQEAATLP